MREETSPIFKITNECGETGKILLAKDWSATPLGMPSVWPGELFSYLNIMLGSTAAACLVWGNENVFLYNDSFKSLFSAYHSDTAYGAPLSAAAGELIALLGPALEEGKKGNSGFLNNVKLNTGFSDRSFKLSFLPLYSGGPIKGVLLTAEEVISEYTVLQKLNEDRALFQILSDASPVLTATCDPDGAADYFSTSWLTLTGWKKEALTGYGWIGIIHADDKDSFLEVYKQAVKERKDWKGTFRIKSAGGTYHMLAAAGTPLHDTANKFLGYISSSIDITEQHRLMSTLQQNEEQLNDMIQTAPIGICLLDASTLVSEIVNKSFLEVAGKPYHAIAGQYYWDSFAEAKAYYEDALAGVVEKGETFFANEVELMLIRHGKQEIVFVTFVYSPIKDSEGKVQKVAVWVLENTQQVKEREKVAQSERETRALIESAPFPIGVYKGREMRIALANNAIIDIWGKGPDVIGKLFSQVVPELDNQEVFQQLDTVYTTGKSFHIKNQRLDLTVEDKIRTFYFNYSLTPLFDSDGEIYGVMNTGADVTELNIAQRKVEENERNLRSTILQAPAAMCIFRGPEFVVEIANKRMLEFWGKTEDQVLNKPIFTGLPEARQQGFEDLLTSVYRNGETVSAEAVPVTLLRDQKVQIVYVNFTYEAFREPDGSISGILAVAVDVTAQILAHQKIEDIVQQRTSELAESNENLRQTNSELAQFAYIASHDLQEPLRKINVFAQMLENAAGAALQGRAAEYLLKIKTAATRMTALVRDVLAYSELGKSEDTFEQTDLQLIIESILNDYELLIEQKEAQITLEGLVIIEAIPLQMNQLFANLISNALKYSSKEKKPEISITGSVPSSEETHLLGLREDAEYVKIAVKDNGIGIAPEHLDQIFSIFKRLHRKSEFEGTGIGLAICRKIVQNHAGEINAEGSSSAGAVFNIFLPKL